MPDAGRKSSPRNLCNRTAGCSLPYAHYGSCEGRKATRQSATPAAVESRKRTTAARNAALTRLREAHRDEYDLYYREALAVSPPAREMT